MWADSDRLLSERDYCSGRRFGSGNGIDFLTMNCWNSAFNAQWLRVTIVVVQVRTGKICVAALEALRKKERQYET